MFSRAYINFNLSEDLFDFKDKFHGHVFVSNKGNQYVCNVEYAPNQKVPKPVIKKDPRDGTIERGMLLSAAILPMELQLLLDPSVTANISYSFLLKHLLQHGGVGLLHLRLRD